MAGTVSSWQQGAFTTPINGTTSDATVVLSNDNATRVKHNSHDSDPTIHVQSSTLASRPAASTAQQVWVTTDTLKIYIDSGVAWQELNYLPIIGGTVIGNFAVTGTLGAGGLASLNAGVAVTGNATVTGTLGVTGNVAVNTNKFTVAAASGNTVVAGTLGVTGAVTLTTDISIGGNISLGGVGAIAGATTISATGNISGASLTATSGGAAITGTLAVTGSQTISVDLAVTGGTTMNGGGAVIGTFSVSGVSTFASITPTSIKLAGTSASFPGLFRSGTQINVRLANDSADADLQVGGLFVTNGQQISAGGLTISQSGLIMSVGTANLIRCAPSTTTYPSIRFPHGTAPSSPTDGDVWTTTSGLFVRINGATVGPLT